MKKLALLFPLSLFLAGCGDDAAQEATNEQAAVPGQPAVLEGGDVKGTESPDVAEATQSAPATNIVEIGIDGWTFVGPSEAKSGWTTIRVKNDSGMTHMGLVYRLPEGVTPEMLSREVVDRIQGSLTAALAGDFAKAQEINAGIPAWIGDLVYMGGPGLIGDGVTGEATMYLEPGNYIVECYVKTAGMQHNYNPDPNEHGMVLPLTILDEPGGMAEPDANVTLEIRNTGYTLSEGAFHAGVNHVRARFVEQRLYNNFVGHDVHVFRIEPEMDVDAAAMWADFFPLDGQQTPAPAHYVGGIHDMPEGSEGYFTLTLEPGDYGFVAEIPNAKETGLFMQITVPEE